MSDADEEAAPEEEQPREPVPGEWDSDAGREFAARLERSRDLPLHADGWGAGGPTPGERLDAFAAGRALETTIAGRPRSADPDDDRCPNKLKTGMRACQKPFHLWNVERQEMTDPPAPDRLDPFVVGRGAALPDEQRPPRTIEKATRQLVDWALGQQLRREMDRRDLLARKQLLVDPLPFGKPDEPDEPQGRTVRIDIAGGGKLPPGFDPRRFRGPPELLARLARPRDDDDGPSFPGGVDLAQPDDDDDGGGGPAGFGLSQPDDD